MYSYQICRINPLPINPKILQKKTNKKVIPNLSLGINWHGPTFSSFANANADENNEETNENQKKSSKAMVSPFLLMLMIKIIINS